MISIKIKKILAIPHFHYDVEWWKTEDLYNRDVEEILLKALDLLGQYPEFTYVIDQALGLKPFWDKYPEKRELIQRFIKEGKIELVGGTYSAADENIPYGEALVRQFIYGKKFFQDIVGAQVKTAWMIDEFGHPSQVPQIVAKSGFNCFVFSRGVIPYNAKLPLNFYWQSPDGTKILTHWFAAHYIGMINFFPTDNLNITHYFKELKARINYEGEERGVFDTLMVPFGSDFTIPKELWIKFVKVWNEKEDIKIKFSLPQEYISKVLELNNLPTLQQEFNPVFDGCYESRILVKQLCRKSQNEIMEAEKYCGISYLFGKDYPQADLDTAWENILKNDMHDIICGTGTDKVYQNTIKRYNTALNLVSKNKDYALSRISKEIDTSKSGKPYIVFNSLNWEREEIVSIPIPEATSFSIYDSEGNIVPSQANDNELLFLAKVPSLGYKVFYLRPKEEDYKFPTTIPTLACKAERGCFYLENRYLKLEIDSQSGGIKKLLYKGGEKEQIVSKYFAGGEIIGEEEVGNLWTIHKTGKIFRKLKDPAKINLKESGPLRAVMEIETKHHKMEVNQRIIIYNHSPRIDFETKIDFKGKDRRVKVVFPLNFAGSANFETPYGVTERGFGHWCIQNWVDYSDGNCGLAILSKGNPGVDYEDKMLSLTLFRSLSIFSLGWVKFVLLNLPGIINKISEAIKLQKSGLNIGEWALSPYHGMMLREHSSKGGPPVKGGVTLLDHLVPWLKWWQQADCWERRKHNYQYALYPHSGDYRSGKVALRGWEFNQPLTVIPNDSHSGELPPDLSFLKISPDSLVLTVLKKAEKSDKLILRVYETEGEDKNFSFQFFKPLKRVEKISLSEEEVYQNIEVKEDKFQDLIRKWEIATYSLDVM